MIIADWHDLQNNVTSVGSRQEIQVQRSRNQEIAGSIRLSLRRWFSKTRRSRGPSNLTPPESRELRRGRVPSTLGGHVQVHSLSLTSKRLPSVPDTPPEQPLVLPGWCRCCLLRSCVVPIWSSRCCPASSAHTRARQRLRSPDGGPWSSSARDAEKVIQCSGCGVNRTRSAHSMLCRIQGLTCSRTVMIPTERRGYAVGGAGGWLPVQG